uniref:Large ribosomal subunit protein uL22c n=1 Tax=Opuntia streptacantha TaxID=393608 RepID=A0A7C8YP32_OPUST
MRWQSQLRCLINVFGKRVEQNLAGNGNFRNLHTGSQTPILKLVEPKGLQLPFEYATRPLHHYFQQMGISTSRMLLSDPTSDATPVSSPLIPISAHKAGKSESPTENQAVKPKPDKVQAVLKGIKQSPKKVNLVAALVRGMRVEDALLQLQVTVKRAAKTVYQVIHSARANALHNHGLDADRLLVAEAFVGKGFYKKRLSYHAKMRHGIKMRPECRLTVVVRELTDEEEAEVAKLRVSNFKKLTKREKRLVPHKLIESTPIWGRKNRTNSQTTPIMA